MSVELDTERALPAESAAALATFVRLNPHYQGAGWADCLEVLADSDSHLDVTEPLWEQIDHDLVPPGGYLTRIILTLLYAGGPARQDPTVEAVAQALGRVAAYLDQIKESP